MRKLIFLAIFIIVSFTVCNKAEDNGTPSISDSRTNCDHNGKPLYLGPQGGCYYFSSGHNKEYVNRSECDCSN
jgi:hypothetical protein